jgi:hypothetical protein
MVRRTYLCLVRLGFLGFRLVRVGIHVRKLPILLLLRLERSLGRLAGTFCACARRRRFCILVVVVFIRLGFTLEMIMVLDEGRCGENGEALTEPIKSDVSCIRCGQQQ